MPCAVALVLGVLLLAVVPVRYAAPRQPLEGTMWQRAAEGIRFIRSRPIILGTISLDLFAVLLGGVVALLPVYAKKCCTPVPKGWACCAHRWPWARWPWACGSAPAPSSAMWAR
jgi:hypothetical protein